MKYLLLLILTLFSMFAFGQELPTNHYKIYSTKRQKIISPDDIISDIENADVLFFGEEHNDSTAHYLEYLLFKKLAEKYPQKAALSMEMFQTDCQLVLNEYLAGFIREKNLVTEGRAWPNYKDYKPLIELAKTNQIPVIAANTPTRYTNMVTRLGLDGLKQLDEQAKSYLPPLPIDTATGAYYDKFVQIMGGHASMPGMQIYQSQNLWDATMAWSIAQFYKKHKDFKILQLNGGFHSEEKLGIVAQLKKYNSKIRVLNVTSLSDDSFNNPDWSQFTKLADYIILTDPGLPKTR
ncbi:ChaN family lipoprotein [Mucilaginibacter celer]|uniref:Haem-binding uptake Tiki superfamily ChaN domain-containing protein n=1 Tax=Mucilaginibacter celer TaxID=2305508 RepID=A0A494W6K6_9SPHI|nr:ChaN family lipoprotein [Mucilaginibacter celer]AYL99423.1 hypothetical protein HYN43_011695 [Mucilaginibacter celer]